MKAQIRTFAILLMLVNLAQAQSTMQAGTTRQRQAISNIQTTAASNVIGSGTPGRLSKWTGNSGVSTFVLGDSNIFEDKFGKIGIGTTTPASPLTVQGMIETTMGGYKFPDGTIQSTAFSAGLVVSSLNELKGDVILAAGSNITITPSGNTLTIAAPNSLAAVAHNATLQGNGTSGSPLGVAIPLNLTGPVPGFSSTVLTVQNTSGGGGGVLVEGGDSSNGTGGFAVNVVGGDSSDFGNGGGIGVRASGGAGTYGGNGVDAAGGEGSSSDGGIGVRTSGGLGRGAGNSGGIGILAIRGPGEDGATDGPAGMFVGDVEITKDLNVAGTKNFKIDHPLDPENKYLRHAAIESSEVLNVYSGNVATNEQGEATVTLPDWFEALNRDFRYQLTVVGTFAQAIVAEKVKHNRFTIKTNAANVEVSWQVTGVRSDAAMRLRPFKVEEEKPGRERGYYLTPKAFNQPEERSVEWARHPQTMKQLKLRRIDAQQMHKTMSPNQLADACHVRARRPQAMRQ